MTLFLLTVPFAPIVNSPDERANQVFALQFKNSNTLARPALQSGDVDVFIGPRSTVRVEDQLVPNSFFGLPVLSGVMAKIIGDFGIYLITPLFAVAGILAWFFLIRKHVNNASVAYLSAILLAVHPGYWYYSTRVMMHNIPFIASLLLAAWFFLNRPISSEWKNGKWALMNPLFAGGFFALACFLRTNEVLWMVGGFLVMVLVLWKQRYRQLWKDLLLFIVGGFLIALPFLWLNTSIFGHPFTTGYTYKAPMEVVEMPVLEAVDTLEISSKPSVIFSYLFPFGIHERAMLRHAYYYFFLLFPWFGMLTILGYVYVVMYYARSSAMWRIYLAFTAILTLWLVIVYGSWVINDNPDPKLITIGNSYIRYWLPASVLFTLPIAVLLSDALMFFSKKRKRIALLSCIALFTSLSFYQLTFGTDGFLATRKALASFQEKQSIVLMHTPNNAVIITDRSDKFIFPEREVIVPLRDEATYRAIPELVEMYPLYYFGITLPEVDRLFLEEVRFKETQLKVRLVTTIHDESLYEIHK